MNQIVAPNSASFFLKVFGKIQSAPILKHLFFKMMYGTVARASISKSDMVFMNYGYSSDEFDSSVRLEARDENDRYSIQIYEYLFQGADMTGRRVLEVGCGRGGGVSYVARYKRPEVAVGVDFSNTQVRFCRRVHRLENARFMAGNAIDLPLGDNEFDAVINVESSHCYPDLTKFFRQACRVLKPGGSFYYTDFIPIGSSESPPNVLDVILEKLKGAGFEIVRAEDITDNVVRALDKTDEWKKAFYEKDLASAALKATVGDLLATKESESYRLFKDHASIYYAIHARKP